MKALLSNFFVLLRCHGGGWPKLRKGHGRRHALVRPWALALPLLAAPGVVGEESPAPYPLDYWAMRSVIDGVELSPDGKHLALMRIPSKDGNPIVEIYDAADLGKQPFRLNAEPMEIIGFSFISDAQILFQARQAVRDTIRGREQDTYKYKLGLLDLERKQVREFGSEGSATIAHLLPHSPNKIMLAMVPPGRERQTSTARRIAGYFTPRDYYEFDLVRGTRKLLFQGKLSRGNYRFTPEGRRWLASGFDRKEGDVVRYWRPSDGAPWEEVHRASVDEYEFQPFTVVGRDEGDEDKADHALVLARNGHDTVGLWSYDLKNKAFSEIIYRRAEVDVSGVRNHSNTWQHPDVAVGVAYFTDKLHVEYFDEAEGATYRQLADVIPHAHDVSIVSRSRDGASLVVRNSGPRDPGTFYLLKSGKLETIGSRQPLFESERLADVEYVTYPSRDDRQIPAYLTIPSGEPPFPAIVLPHGGPAARDYGGYDKWAQLLANNGYVVIQPQFRGSTGFGLALRQAAFEDGGQQGRKMQDDKDDAALYLVERGLAVKDRLAMFGWSYGGYAAGVAATRTPQLYQCVIAGAAVFDPWLQLNQFQRFQMAEAVRKRYERMTETAVSPIEEADKVNVPMLIVHGVVDTRVTLDQATKYIRRLDEHEKPYKYVELEGAGHFYGTLLYDHQLEFFTAMIDFLANDCGPGGL